MFDVLKSVAKVAAPIAKIAAPIAIDIASKEAKKRISGGMMKVKVMNGLGSPYVSPPYKQAMKYTKAGGSIYPAGGSSGGSIYPAGKYGKGISENNPIQLGGPYTNLNSPAFHPFIETRSIQSYDKI